MKVLSMLAISVTVKLHIRVAQQILKLMWKCLKALLTRRRPLKGVIVKYSRTFVLSSSRMASHQHPFLITPGSIIIIVRHATAVLSVLAVRYCIQPRYPAQWLLTDSLGEGMQAMRWTVGAKTDTTRERSPWSPASWPSSSLQFGIFCLSFLS